MATFADFIEHRLRSLPEPELRKDPVLERWVIIAPDRAKRPISTESASRSNGDGRCPFCPGHEEDTPPEVAAVRAPGSRPNQPDWRVRVVPNRFPALEITANQGAATDGFFEKRGGFGVHEVIIESPRHERSLTHLSTEHVREVLKMYRDRLVELKRDQRLRYAIIFKNVGPLAGASLEHTHTQLIAMPMVPVAVEAELHAARRLFEARGRCVYCEILRQETLDGSRVVLDGPGFVAIAPFASCFPFEMRILPKRHGSHYEDLQEAELQQLASVLRTALRKLETGLDDPPYNVILHTAPFGADELGYYHWHIEITPRLTRTAGFEWGTGFYINPVPPEQAAEYLREVNIPDLSGR